MSETDARKRWRRFRLAIVALAGVLHAGSGTVAQGGESGKLQMYLGPRGDPNVYCSGECFTNSCCIVP